jgi:(1->4)-alpha-D-glucan 1-alpha-D-glucosylmutase
MELPQLFDHAHSLVFRLLEGIRLDHVDGLLDPKGYCSRLRAAPVIMTAELRSARIPEEHSASVRLVIYATSKSILL